MIEGHPEARSVPVAPMMSGMPGTTESPGLRDESLQPWQLFVLAGLGCATAAVFLARGQGLTRIVLVSALMGTAVLVGVAVLRALKPLVAPEDDRTSMIGDRTRVALEREKALVLRAIKELEFDKAMGKVSDADWQDMAGRLRARAARLMRQLDAGSSYRDRIEQDLARRVRRPAGATDASAPSCPSCAMRNDVDAKFCKSCGQRL